MEVSNASMYDGSTALTEAVLMGARISQRNRLLVASSVHPEYRAVVATTIRQQGLTLELIGYDEDGRIDSSRLEAAMGNDIAAIVVQSPNFFGNLESLKELSAIAHKHSALLIVTVAEALSLGIVTPPGEAGADIVCGEAQSLGVPVSFGGPHVGFLCCREKFLRTSRALGGATVDLTEARLCADSSTANNISAESHLQHLHEPESDRSASTVYCSLLGKSGFARLPQERRKTQYALSENRPPD
jgi:glycine dehydrogenase subunit 1